MFILFIEENVKKKGFMQNMSKKEINNNISSSNYEGNQQDISKSKQFIKQPIVKKISICALIGVCSIGSYFIGKEVGINSPATSKHYFSFNKLASVNGEEISFNDFKASMNILFYMNKTNKMSSEEIANYESQFIEYNVLNKAVYDVAVKAGVKSDEESVKMNYSSIMEQLSEILNMDTDTILKKFKLTESGVLESLRREYIVNAYLEQESVISEDDALKYYNENSDEFYEYKASHILIPTSDENGNELSNEEKEKAKLKAEELLTQIKNGANFEELAKLNSTDGSAKDGGDLGYFAKGEMVPEFEKAVSETEIGQLYPEIVETTYGYHIIKRTGENVKSFEEEKDSIISQLSYDKKNELVEKIKSEADIKIHYNN